jgi:hypothetical protein
VKPNVRLLILLAVYGRAAAIQFAFARERAENRTFGASRVSGALADRWFNSGGTHSRFFYCSQNGFVDCCASDPNPLFLCRSTLVDLSPDHERQADDSRIHDRRIQWGCVKSCLPGFVFCLLVATLVIQCLILPAAPTVTVFVGFHRTLFLTMFES